MQRLVSTQRRMFRWIVGIARLPDEDWVTYIRRATHASESASVRHGCQSWVATHIRKKWLTAATIARRADNRWTTRLLNWTPWFRCKPCRAVGRPVMRWDDMFTERCGGDWQKVCAETDLWGVLCETSVNSALGRSRCDDDVVSAP